MYLDKYRKKKSSYENQVVSSGKISHLHSDSVSAASSFVSEVTNGLFPPHQPFQNLIERYRNEA